MMIETQRVETRVLDEATIQDFKARLRGPLLRPGDASYDDARAIWNGMIDKKPVLIARCTGTADVVEAVNYTNRSSTGIVHLGTAGSASATSPRR